jgi:hypothetical protein
VYRCLIKPYGQALSLPLKPRTQVPHLSILGPSLQKIRKAGSSDRREREVQLPHCREERFYELYEGVGEKRESKMNGKIKGNQETLFTPSRVDAENLKTRYMAVKKVTQKSKGVNQI